MENGYSASCLKTVERRDGQFHLRNYTYNALGQVTRLLNQIGSTTISDFSSIGYDGVGNRNALTASIPGSTSLNGTTGYTYDTKDQLTQETSTRNAGFTDNFGYDSAGNPTTFKGVTKTYNSNNQQTASGFVHDGNGNPTTYNGTALIFDPENRLTSHGLTLTAGYSGDGLRAWKQTISGKTYFLYDGTMPVIELNLIGVVTATNTFGAQGLVSRRTGVFPLATSVFYTFDGQGCVAQRLDATGTVLSSHFFSAHGSPLNGTSSDPFGYKAQFGYYTDNETGLQLLTHRYYDPSNGRFLTPDPIGYSGSINLYSYVENNPANAIDPSGLKTYVIFWDPVGHGESSFGHVSVIINDISYSWGPSNVWFKVGREGRMDSRPALDFLWINRFRNGHAYELDLTPDEERRFEDFLRHVHGKYALGRYNNCGAPVVLGLKDIGHDLGGGWSDLLPSDLLRLLKQASGPRGSLVDGTLEFLKQN